jgi:Uma2 family endonuclease
MGQAATKNELVGVAEYLAAEEASDNRHEYLGGFVYAMAGETRTHNQIVQNVAFALRRHFGRGPCKLYVSDVRVNLDLRSDEYFYYPDVVVTCDKRDTHPRFVRYPKLIVEVLATSTERIDRREKFFAYTNVPSLEEYVLIGQDTRELIVFRRESGWRLVRVAGAKAKILLKSVQAPLSSAAVYEGLPKSVV